MQKSIENWQIRSIFAMGRDLGIVQAGSHDDNLHALVEGITGKESIKLLSFKEATQVISRLKTDLDFGSPPPERKKASALVSTAQISKIWALMYQLSNLDTEPDICPLRTRLKGVAQKALGRDFGRDYNWLQSLSKSDANKVTETLKRYVASAKRKNSMGGADGEPTG